MEYDDEDNDFDARFNNMVNTGRPRGQSERRDSIKTGVTEVVKKQEAKKPAMEEQQIEARLMSKDEVKQVIQEADFQSFLKTSARYVERALGAEFDFRGEFFIDEEDDKTKEQKENKRKLLSKKFTMEE